MADRRKRSPAMRYIKRNGLYILIVCVLLLVVGSSDCRGRAGEAAVACKAGRALPERFRDRAAAYAGRAVKRCIRRDGKRAGACG